VQVCAQALCLEEMLDVAVPEAALFYGKEQRREVVEIDQTLRSKTEEVANGVHRMILEACTPAAEYMPKCDNCSLMQVCLPKAVGSRGNRVTRYLASALDEP
jgi:CRISPR-associated exonuclease Cas4